MGGDRIRRVIILELQEEDGEVFEDFLSFLQDHPEIENCKQNKDSIISLPGLEIYPRQRRVYRNEQEIPLTKTEYEILLYLFQNSNHVLTHSQIYERIWREPDYGEARKLVSHHVRGSSLNQAAASFYSLALKKLRASVRCPFCHTSKWRWFPVEFPVVPT